MAVPALLATGRVHHHLVATQARTRAGLLVESAEAREVHHFCTLVGYGADAVCPWLAFEALGALRSDGKLAASESDDALAAKYIKARVSSLCGLKRVCTAFERSCSFDVLGAALVAHAQQAP